MENTKQLSQRLQEILSEIDEISARLPAHSIKPPQMMSLMDLEDEYDRVRARLDMLNTKEVTIQE